jgi:glutamate 5-kinase
MMKNIVMQIMYLENKGYEVILVSSGAVGAGLGVLKDMKRPMNIPEKQVAASVGQVILIRLYQEFFLKYNQNISQILLTKSDIEDRERYLNIRDVFFELLNRNIVPIINENDAVITDEIRVGDNDTLSALVANLIDADLLIILSDIDGLYDSNPMENNKATLIKEVKDITSVLSFAKDSNSSQGTGGMITKLSAANIVNSFGINMIIANGNEKEILKRIVSLEDIGTLFIKHKNSINARRQWIGFNSKVEGTVIIDEGAKKAILNNKSLLPIGVKSVEGEFKRGQTIGIMDKEGIEIARGLTSFGSESLSKIIGLNSNKIIEILGYKDADNVVHINNMMIKE